MAIVLSSKVSVQVPPSKEEDDQLQRSSKKSKNDDNVPTEEWPKLGDVCKSKWVAGPSFAEKLQGINKNGVESNTVSDHEMSDDPISDDDDSEPLCKIKENPGKNFPTFIFSSRMKKRLYKAWNRSLIIKLLGKTIGYKLMLSILQPLWAKPGVISLINIGNGYFVVKFTNQEDYKNALTGGPWMLFDHYLTVRPWEPQFHPLRDTIKKVVVWVRLPKVFLEYYDKEALSWIGDRIGETIKVDINTSNQLRGQFARICVLVDLSKQLMSGFTLDGEDYFLEYEGLHGLCTSCGIYGHSVESCTMGGGKQRAGDQPDENNSVIKETEAASSGDQGVWKVVQKPKRVKQTPKEKQSGTLNQHHSGSRFFALADENPTATMPGNSMVVTVAPVLAPTSTSRKVTAALRAAESDTAGVDRAKSSKEKSAKSKGVKK
ncbi:hypothetical protein QN277_027087 [Acacia crassicarpa]|uniref:DUF4283 domain-containing protein n=1 Tax=Acacia crassicarpa TaxID=499986 RepID=A0AAE1JAP6_9FABA|nr:hypothetical protein QN277_027087 [Acacia crassicarpa]